jgi:hypothetical protein
MKGDIQVFKIYYDRIFLCFMASDSYEKAINKAYLKYSTLRPELEKDKLTARKS